jgi:transcriptional regulator with XRE-family HTH domain
MGQPSPRRGLAQDTGPDPIDVEVGHNLRRLRLARGFTQTELGEALGISFQQVQKYERGVNRLSASMLVKAARFLRTRAADLLPPDDQVDALPAAFQRLAGLRGGAAFANAFQTVQRPALNRALLQLFRAIAREENPAAKERVAEPAPPAR